MKKIISMFLVLCLVFGLSAVSAFAGAPDAAPGVPGGPGDPGGPGGDSSQAPGSGDSAQAPGGPGGGDSAQAPGGPGGDSAQVPGGPGGPGGPGSGGANDTSTGTQTVVLVPEEMEELIIGAEGYDFTTDVYTKKLEIAPEAQITSQYPIIVFFEESDSVENGTIIGNVQFVSDYDEVIAIVHTNDVHGHLDVEPYVKGLADELKASGDYSLVLTVSAGDVYGGGEAVAGSYNGEFIPAIMDPIYDVIAPGNNDYGSSGVVRQNILLSRLYENTRTICANVETMEDGLALSEYAQAYESIIGDDLFDELYEKVTTDENGGLDLSALEMEDLPGDSEAYPHTAVFTTDQGTVVGLFGLTTNGGALSVELDSTGSIPSSEACVQQLREDGADIVIGVGHTGWMGEESTGASSNDTNSWQLADQVEDLDVFIDGHTHSIINDGQGVLVGSDPTYVNQAESFGNCIGEIFLYVKDGKVLAVDGNIIRDMEDIQPDAQVQELVDLAMARVKEDFGKPIAYTEYFLNGERLSAGNEGGTVRGNETNLGDLMTDVILAAASEKMGTDYDFVAYPGFWLRASVEPGDITLENLQGIFANPTVLYYDTLTGQQVVDMVAKGLGSVYPEKEDTTFTHYSGIEVTYTYQAGSGTPVTIKVGDTLVYDAANGGLQVDEDWTCEGILTMTGGEIDNYTGDMANWICSCKEDVQQLVGSWFQNHTAENYTVYPNTIAPGGRIVEVEG
ncbi:MAG: bifunctional metallophosphatase/5'-nucleotidase [Parasporobacterium sp.]|nr:bifunctional metallophosphatase/5'-nucleotidase [Parasporobacterium sp.]